MYHRYANGNPPRPSQPPRRAPAGSPANAPGGPAQAARRPRSTDEVMRWIEEGRLTPSEAFNFFQDLEGNELAEARSIEQERRLERTLAELDVLVGLKGVKELVQELQAYVEIQRRRRDVGLSADALVLHMVFKGNPGTGKTTVARILGNVFRETGVLNKGHLVEVERADVVGEYIGHTAQKMREQIKKSLGGILFVDEAYALARGGEKDFGKEAIDTLVKAMEDHRESLVVILAGYRDEMEWFLRQNPGLRSRFPIQMDFPDYDGDELMEIAQVMLRERQYRLDQPAELRMREMVGGLVNGKSRGNARAVRNLIERAIRRQAVRLVKGGGPISRDQLLTITADELEAASET